MPPSPGPQRTRNADEFAQILTAEEAPMDEEPPRHGRQRRRRRWIWPWVLGFFLVILIAVGGAGLFAYSTYPEQVKSLFGWSNDYTGDGTGSVDVEIRPGDIGANVATTLYREHVTKTYSAFYQLITSKTVPPVFQPGTFRLKEHMSAASALAALEDPANRVQSTIAIPEGLTAKQILVVAAKSTGLPLAEFQAAAKDYRDLGVPKGAPNIEGWLFPATYTIQPGTSARSIVQTMVTRTKQALDSAGVAESDREHVLTLAGLVQKEGNGKDDAKVARVFLNRIAQGMRLQSDATVSYGAGGTTVVPTAAQYKDKNPYNTYLRDGLPAGPISSPGDAAIAAAIHPAKGSWLYFVTVNLQTGETVFSTTLAQHDKAAAQFTRWLKAHPDYAK